MHPAFFEMAYVHAQLGRYARAWDNARDAARPEDARTIGAWVSEAALLCKELEESVARAEGEV